MSNRQYTRQSPRASSKMASSSSSKPNKSLLKAALTKNVTLSDTITPNTSTITPNTTAMEIEKVKRNHNQNQITPRTVLAEKPPNSGNGIDANELFNMAKAATKARREKHRIAIPQKETPDLVTKTSDPDDAQISEEENENSVEEENADPKGNSLPTLPLNKKLKRKSRAVTKRRFTKDDDLSNDEAKEQDDSSLNDESGEANEETIAKPSVMLKRRRTKSIMPPSKSKAVLELNNETEESSVNDESGEANDETIAKPSAVLKRRRTKSIMPSTKSKAVRSAQSATSDTENDPENITNTDDEIEEQVEKLKLNRKSVGHRKALETALAMIHRAPTPAKVGKPLQENENIDDMRRASSAKDIDVIVAEDDDEGEEELTFHPNVESTRVGSQQFNQNTPFQKRVEVQESNPDTPFHPNVESTRVGSQELNQNTPFHPNVESTQVGTQQLNPDTPFQPNVESTRVGSQELNPNTPFHPSVESSRVGSQELNQNTPFHPNVESTRVETQELSQDTPNVQNEKEGYEINTNGSYTDDVITRFDKLTRKSVNASTGSGQEVLADITEQKSPNGTRNATPQVEGSPKSSSRKRSVSRTNDKTRPPVMDEDDRGSYIANQSQLTTNLTENDANETNGALTENGTGNTPIQDASGISQTSKLSSELQEEHRGSNSPQPSKSDHSTGSEHEIETVDTNEDVDNGEDNGEVTFRRLSKELMPPPQTSNSGPKSGPIGLRNTPLMDSVLVSSGRECLSESRINQILDEEVDMHQVTETRRVTKKKPKPKEKVPKENPNEYPYIGQAFKAMYRGQIDRNASPEKIEQFYEEAMTRLRHQTGGLPAMLGDWKDLMIHYKYIPPNDKLNIRLFGLLRMYLDETQYMQLIPYPLLDGTRDYTLPKDLWNWRATDEESQEAYLPPLQIYGEKRRKRKNRKA